MKGCLIALLVLLSAFSLPGQTYSFRKINSGTKADIRNISPDMGQGLYFVTDKIHTLDGDTWKTIPVPVEGKIYYFSAQTVHNHIKTIYEKMQVHSRAQVVTKAFREKLV